MEQIRALKLALMAAGFRAVEATGGDALLLDGETTADTTAVFTLDDPLAEVEAPVDLADLLAGVSLVVRSRRGPDTAKRAKLRLMQRLYKAGFWVGNEPPVDDWRKVVVP